MRSFAPFPRAHLISHDSSSRGQLDARTLAMSLLRLLYIDKLKVLVAAWTSRSQLSGAKTFLAADGDTRQT